MDSPAPPDLRQRSVLITGAGDGLGAELALAAGRAGAEVILLGRTVHKLEQVYDAIVREGGPCPAIYPLDLEGASPDDYQTLADNIESQCGALDGLIHNAAILGRRTPIEQYPPLEWARVLQVDLNAPMLLTQALLPRLQAAQTPCVLFLGEDKARAYWGAYGVAKAGLRALAKIVHDELEARAHIRVEHIDPGPMRTGLRRSAYWGESPEEVPAPEEIAPTILARLVRGP